MEDAAARLITELKRNAERHLRVPVNDAVLTIPTWFNTAQREALKRAFISSGVLVHRVVHEPSAILLAYAYGHPTPPATEHNVVVVDLGAGSLQVAVGCLEEGFVDMKAVAGDPETGGDFFELRLLDLLVGEFHRQHGIGASQNGS